MARGGCCCSAVPSDRFAAEAVRRVIPRARLVDAVGRVDLLTAYALLKRARLFIGNDSGLMHLAAAAGAPTLGLFGPSDERLYAPWGPRARVLRGPRDFDAFKADRPAAEPGRLSHVRPAHALGRRGGQAPAGGHRGARHLASRSSPEPVAAEPEPIDIAPETRSQGRRRRAQGCGPPTATLTEPPRRKQLPRGAAEHG